MTTGAGQASGRPAVGPRGLVLVAAVLFGTTGTARALEPDISPLGVGASRIAGGAALLAVVSAVLARRARAAAPGGASSPGAARTGGAGSPGAARTGGAGSRGGHHAGARPRWSVPTV